MSSGASAFRWWRISADRGGPVCFQVMSVALGALFAAGTPLPGSKAWSADAPGQSSTGSLPSPASSWEARTRALIKRLETIDDFNDEQNLAALRMTLPQMFIVGVDDPCPITSAILDTSYVYDAVLLASENAYGGFFIRPDHFRRSKFGGCKAAEALGGGAKLRRDIDEESRSSRIRSWKRFGDQLKASAAGTLGVPPVIFLDHEGGSASPFSADAPKMRLASALPSAMALATASTTKEACLAGFIAGLDTRRLGADVDLAPVMDVQSPGAIQVLGDRSFSSDPLITGAVATAYFEGLSLAGATPALKHFPGHGRRRQRIHDARLPTSPELLASNLGRDLKAYRSSFGAGSVASEAKFVMSAFFDPQGSIAEPNVAFSRLVMTDLLRGGTNGSGRVTVDGAEVQSLGFRGLLISDDLLMAAMALSGSTRSGNALAATSRSVYVDHTIANVRRLFEAGHDMFLVADVECVRSACWPTEASIDHRALTRRELDSVISAFWQYLTNAEDPRSRLARLSRARATIVRILTEKLRILTATPPRQPDNTTVAAALNGLWESAFAWRMRPLWPLGATDQMVVASFVPSPPLGRSARFESADPALTSPQHTRGLRGFRLGGVFADTLAQLAAARGHQVRRLRIYSCTSTLPEARESKPSAEHVESCRLRQLDALDAAVGSTHNPAIVLSATSTLEWSEATALIRAFDAKAAIGALSRKGDEVDRPLQMPPDITIVADGQPEILAASDGTERANVFVTFTGYGEQLAYGSHKLLRLLENGSTSLKLRRLPLAVAGLAKAQGPKRMSCKATLQRENLLPP